MFELDAWTGAQADFALFLYVLEYRLATAQNCDYLYIQEDVAMTRTLKTSTIVNHLASCIDVGLPLDIARLGVTDSMITIVTNVIRKPPINSGKLSKHSRLEYKSL